MNIRNRIQKLEVNKPTNCFCGKTLIDLWYKTNMDDLTHCAKCKDRYDFWAKVSTDALLGPNLTDEAI